MAGEEPRYNGVDLHRNSLPGTSDSDNGTPLLAPDNCTESEPVDNTIPQIAPPKGFEPDSSPLNAHSYNIDRAGSSSSSQSSSLTSNANDQLNSRSICQQLGDRSREIQVVSDNSTTPNGSTNGHDTTTINSSQTMVRDRASKESQPIPSTSTHRIINGFSSIVTKLTKAFASTSISMINTDRCLQEESPKFVFGNKRTLEKTWKLMDKVVKCCQQPEMNLNNSPPFILEILPETYQHLKLIHTNRSYPTNDNEYSLVFLRNLQNRCKQTLKLFKEAREEMFDEESDYRHKLTRNTLVFNHILSELKAIFPHGHFIGDKYLITKKESAGEFWKNSFGTSVLVDWKTFYHAMQQVHHIDSSFFSLHALKQTIDLTCDDYISIFEFDVFTRLFQPWSTLLKNWQILAVTHPGYKAFWTYDELKARLQKYIDKPGSYVFRLSCTRLGQWAIGYVTPDRQILQTIVQNISLSQALTETKCYLYPDGQDEDPSLNILCSGMAGDERNVTVTEEQYEIYCGVGNSFQTCKICFENDKDIRVEPCNHLLCTSCLLAWQESEGQGCPYCRTEIKETVQITMDLPRTTH